MPTVRDHLRDTTEELYWKENDTRVCFLLGMQVWLNLDKNIWHLHEYLHMFYCQQLKIYHKITP